MTCARTAGIRRPTALRVPNTRTTNTTTNTTTKSLTHSVRSIEMYTMHEALARERMLASQREAQQLRVARELASARRWHRLEALAHRAGRRAHAVGRRHAVTAL